MNMDSVITLAQHALELLTVMVTVVLVPALLVGLLVSMFQAATQINEMTLSFIPKLLITFFTLLAAGPWLLRIVVDYTRRLFENIPYMIG